jgi:hypothetical protein
MMGLANASPGKQVLDTVPVEADGSAHFRAPARVPLAFQALDELGRAVQVMRSVTYLQPGETAAWAGCHDHAHPGGVALLTGDPEGLFSVSCNALAPRVSFSAWGGKPGDFREVNSEPLSKPGFFGVRGSSLMKLLRNGHREVKLEPADFECLAKWMGANALFYGTLDKSNQARQRHGERIAGPAIE